jgi:hypothetical protein
VLRHWHAPHRYQRVSAEAPCENLHKRLRRDRLLTNCRICDYLSHLYHL